MHEVIKFENRPVTVSLHGSEMMDPGLDPDEKFQSIRTGYEHHIVLGHHPEMQCPPTGSEEDDADDPDDVNPAPDRLIREA
tara:strand:- start:4225 stop:4467 length:243 start_codon:yes stop_codon:yes gene_type:complete